MVAELQNISKHYDQPGSGIRNVILNGISLSVGERDSIAIVGPSGSGKSTLLNILGTLDRPSSGRVILDGTDTDTLDENRLADRRNRFIGFVFQLHHLLPQLTLLENVLLPALPVKDPSVRKMTIERAKMLIERVGLKDQVHHRPVQMSVGECQRAAVVRALINQPRLLLADEPTAALDKDSGRMAVELFRQLADAQQAAIVMVTHDNKVLDIADRVVQLEEGRLVEGHDR